MARHTVQDIKTEHWKRLRKKKRFKQPAYEAAVAPYRLITAVSHLGSRPCYHMCHCHIRTESCLDSTHRGRIEEARIVTVVLSLIRPRIVEVERFTTDLAVVMHHSAAHNVASSA